MTGKAKIALGIVLMIGALIALTGLLWMAWLVNVWAWNHPIAVWFPTVLAFDGAFIGIAALAIAGMTEP